MTPSLTVVVWIGVITALMASLIALAQFDIKRILAYSTVSQLGLMMVSLGVGGVAAGMMHLLAHGFSKRSCSSAQARSFTAVTTNRTFAKWAACDRLMPVTFLTYAIGMMTLSGVPFFFSGGWTKEEILHATAHWPRVARAALPDAGRRRADRALHDAADDLRFLATGARTASEHAHESSARDDACR
mgnify:CR=1 FL=1